MVFPAGHEQGPFIVDPLTGIALFSFFVDFFIPGNLHFFNIPFKLPSHLAAIL
jgi:hypothetical protein